MGMVPLAMLNRLSNDWPGWSGGHHTQEVLKGPNNGWSGWSGGRHTQEVLKGWWAPPLTTSKP